MNIAMLTNNYKPFVGGVPVSIEHLANAFLFSSKSETQGIVVLEAMAQGKPVIAVNATGVCDIYRYQALSKAARETALMYREEIIAKEFEKYYVNLCALKPAYDTIQPNIFKRILNN